LPAIVSRGRGLENELNPKYSRARRGTALINAI
jgi:hypothetical protein